MIRLSRLADYGVVLAGRIASRPDLYHNAMELADATGLPTPTVSKILAALARGEIDGFATDKLVLLALAQAAGMHDYALLPDDLSFEPFAIVLPRGDYEFRLAVNSALAQVFRSGDVVELYTKYFTGITQRPSTWLGAVFTFGGLPE